MLAVMMGASLRTSELRAEEDEGHTVQRAGEGKPRQREAERPGEEGRAGRMVRRPGWLCSQHAGGSRDDSGREGRGRRITWFCQSQHGVWIILSDQREATEEF